MTIYTSPTLPGFLNDAHYGDRLPEDAQALTDAQYATYREAMQAGHTIDFSTCPPTIVDPTAVRETQWRMRCFQAAEDLAATDRTVQRITEAVALEDTTLGAADVIAFMQYRRALRAFPHLSVSDETKPLPVVPTRPAYPAGT